MLSKTVANDKNQPVWGSIIVPFFSFLASSINFFFRLFTRLMESVEAAELTHSGARPDSAPSRVN